MRAGSARRVTASTVAALLVALCVPVAVHLAWARQDPAPVLARAPVRQGPAPVASPDQRHFAVTWAASGERLGAGPPERSYRLVVRTSVGGDALRIRLTNAFGEHPVTFASAYAGLQRQGAELIQGSNRPLTFGGQTSVTVAAGEVILSDPLPGELAPESNLVVSLHVTGALGMRSGHILALQTSYAGAGDHAAEEAATNWAETLNSWYWLDAVSVRTSTAVGSVVVLGDSITDGFASSTDTNRRWPDYLSRRLQATPDSPVRGVANEGISGNKVLAGGAGPAALRRFDRDVLSHPGVDTVFVHEGINDIKAHTGVTVDDLTAGYRQLVDRAHAAGRCVVGATVMPYKGWPEYDDAGEAVRQGVNDWIRHSGVFDAVVDFDEVTRSPDDPRALLPIFDGGDHLHPNDRGMQAMADAVDLAVLRCDR
ncbi:SGNH/GDSL hydrolase family protein [Micromonospora sp. NPDC048839]|uniref:SGNH/GDSL hydrolase family protein n=1 Tax=Micromonospora sp. NPDC048839 TaxID=3155641 RepID=UPI0033DD6197